MSVITHNECDETFNFKLNDVYAQDAVEKEA